MVVVYWRHMQVQYSSDQRSVCSQPGIGISSQNLVPTRVKAWVWAIASATFTPSTSTCEANGCVWRTIQTSPANLDILRVSEVAGVEDGFIVGVAAAEEDAAAGLGAQQHGDDGPGVAVGEGAVHLPQRVADPVRLGTGGCSDAGAACAAVQSPRHRVIMLVTVPSVMTGTSRWSLSVSMTKCQSVGRSRETSLSPSGSASRRRSPGCPTRSGTRCPDSRGCGW